MHKSLPLLLATCLLAACGQTGALYLPDEGVTTPVEIRPAPAAEAQAPAAAPAPEPAKPEDEERDGEKPADTATPGSGS
jgi:predicted small lipoprotein YifL